MTTKAQQVESWLMKCNMRCEVCECHSYIEFDGDDIWMVSHDSPGLPGGKTPKADTDLTGTGFVRLCFDCGVSWDAFHYKSVEPDESSWTVKSYNAWRQERRDAVLLDRQGKAFV